MVFDSVSDQGSDSVCWLYRWLQTRLWLAGEIGYRPTLPDTCCHHAGRNYGAHWCRHCQCYFADHCRFFGVSIATAQWNQGKWAGIMTVFPDAAVHAYIKLLLCWLNEQEEVDNMLIRLNNTLNIVMGSFVGVFIGHSIYKYCDYTKHADLYMIQSAPWYTSIKIYGFGTAIVLSIAVILKLLIKRKQNSINCE